jgi:hypothetical protein
MSKLEDVVPQVELCKLIPDGEFEDAALAWIHADVVGFVCRTSGCEQVAGKEWQLIRSNASRVIRSRKRCEEIYPAPMLEEIMAAMPYCQIYRRKNGLFVDSLCLLLNSTKC